MEVGERGIVYLSLHCHHQNDSCIKVGSDESHFNVSVGSDGQSHKTVSKNHNLSEEKVEPKRYRTEVLPLTSQCLTARPNRLTKVSQLQICSYVELQMYVLAKTAGVCLVAAKLILSRFCSY